MEAQKGEVSCPRSHKLVTERGLDQSLVFLEKALSLWLGHLTFSPPALSILPVHSCPSTHSLTWKSTHAWPPTSKKQCTILILYEVLSVKIKCMCTGENEERSHCLHYLLTASPLCQLIQHQHSFHPYLLNPCSVHRDMLDVWAISAFKELKIQPRGCDSKTGKVR